MLYVTVLETWLCFCNFLETAFIYNRKLTENLALLTICGALNDVKVSGKVSEQ